jgi:hypothetical protein
MDIMKVRAEGIIRKFKKYAHCPVTKDEEGRLIADYKAEFYNAKMSSLLCVDAVLNIIQDPLVLEEYNRLKKEIIDCEL